MAPLPAVSDLAGGVDATAPPSPPLPPPCEQRPSRQRCRCHYPCCRHSRHRRRCSGPDAVRSDAVVAMSPQSAITVTMPPLPAAPPATADTDFAVSPAVLYQRQRRRRRCWATMAIGAHRRRRCDARVLDIDQLETAAAEHRPSRPPWMQWVGARFRWEQLEMPSLGLRRRSKSPFQSR